MDSIIMETIIGLVLAYSLLSIAVSTISELIQRGLSLLDERFGRSGFLRRQLELMLAGNASFVRTILSHPLVDVTDSQGNLHRATNSVEPKNLAMAIVQNIIENNRLVFDKLPKAIIEAFKGGQSEGLKGEKTDITQIEAIIEAWVKKQFTAMTKLYKRNQYIWSFIIGAILVVVLNIDTLQMTRALWKDPTLRAAVVAEAGDVAALSEDDQARIDAQQAVNNLLKTNLPIGWRSAPSPESLDEAVLMPYPLFEPGKDPRVWGDVKAVPKEVLSKLIGLLLTSLAAMMGSDFWFNLLRNLTSRGGGGASKNE